MSRLDKFNALLVALIFAAMPAWAQFTIPFATGAAKSAGSVKSFTSVQVVKTGNACSACTSLSLAVTSTGSGHLLVATVSWANGPTGGISSITGGGTWTIETTSGTGCAQADTGAGFGGVGCAYILSSTSGATTISFTFSASNNYAVTFYEYSYTGTCSKDTSASVVNSTSSTTQSGVSLILAGGNEALFQFTQFAGVLTLSISTPYAIDFQGSATGTYGFASVINGTSGTAPTWTASVSAGMEGGAIAFKLA